MKFRFASAIGLTQAVILFLSLAAASLTATSGPPPVALLAGSPSGNRVYRLVWNGQTSTVTPLAQLPFPAGITTRPDLLDGRPARQFVVSNGNPTFGKSAVGLLSGNSSAPYVGNLGDAYGIAADSVGNLFVAESTQHRVRRITEAGLVEDFAANLGAPYGVAVDASDRVLVTDQAGGRLLRIHADGQVETLASGFGAPNGVAVNAHGSVYVADSAGGKVWQVKPDGTKSVFKSMAPYPTGLAFDAAGWLHVSDYITGEIHAVAPDGTAQLLGRVPGGALFVAAVPPLALLLGPLRFTHENSQLTLTWDASLTLQAAPTADGPFEDVAGAASPWTVKAETETRFFRLRR